MARLLALASALTACALAACAPDGLTSPAAGPPDAAGRDSSAATTWASGAEAAPAVLILSPANNTNVPFAGSGVPVEVAVTVSDAVLGAADLALQWYLDGVEVGETLDATPFTFTGVPFGRRHLAVRIVDAVTGQPLGNPESQATIHVRVIASCGLSADCEDGLSCSGQFCKAGACVYGPIAGCCDHDLECPVGGHCVDGACLQCLGDSECDDGNPCTTDTCAPDGSCEHVAVGTCCQVDGDCDDGDFCTTDLCDVDASACVHVPSADPECCNDSSDCVPANACSVGFCYKSFTQGVQFCRYAPPQPGCCTSDADCDDGNPCSIDACSSPVSGVPGTCSNVQDPAKPLCCLSDFGCDDGDPATDDECVANECQFTLDPMYCALPGTSPVVINELFVARSDGQDVGREWIELVNTTDGLVNITGWTVSTSGGESFTLSPETTIGGSTGLYLPPGTYFALTPIASSTVAGFLGNAIFGTALSLSDPWEDPGFTSWTVSLHDADGVLVDTVTYDASWPLERGRSLELTNPHRDNAQATSWRASGRNSNLILNRLFGIVGKQFGSPRTLNLSAFRGIETPSCDFVSDGSACGIGLCGVVNNCYPGKAEGCCEVDDDCETSEPCTLSSCDIGTGTCEPPEPIAGCCASDDACDDGNPCNIDRCLAALCRHSPNIIPGCCAADEDCDDGDGCTLDSCDSATDTCAPSQPFDPGAGLVCCTADADCDDGDASTLDLCDGGANVCTHPADPEYCDASSDACDDGDPCTVDACNVAATVCTHGATPGCCTEDAQCPDDGDTCTVHVCDLATNACAVQGVPGCCNTAAECDDGDPCTLNTCQGNACQSVPTGGCCLVDEDCTAQGPCVPGSCVGEACVYDEPAAGCCVVGDPGFDPTVCGSDPDGPGTCFAWACSGDVPGQVGSCDLLVSEGCCLDEGDCDDGDACTLDTCQEDTCKHVVVPGGGCCAGDLDCASAEYCGGGTLCLPDLANGEACEREAQCLSEICDGVCLEFKPLGYSCTDDTQCGSGLCADAVCCTPNVLLGAPCDGADLDLCLNGTVTCSPDGLSVECVNETVEGLVEQCNSMDDDCDGLTDESCVPDTCGDGTCAPAESCHVCPSDCGLCDGDCCSEHGGVACEDGATVACVCGYDQACCDDLWDGVCAELAVDLCSATCASVCGDGVCAADEGCAMCAEDCGLCPGCGDGACDVLEDCDGCPEDCGACTGACGDGTCDAGEGCLGCPEDCGVCVGACCTVGGLGCEDAGVTACVCAEDPFCCSDAWDEPCTTAASDVCGADCVGVCGDGTCDGGETALGCPADCAAAICGDGTCDGDGGEDCASCMTDCGMCPGCGDGTCDAAGGETCGNCPTDCATCGGDCCEVQTLPGCADLATASCVCFADPFCCSDLWDDLCVAEAVAGCGLSCGDVCGDGACGLGESCATCLDDCGACPGACGDGECGPGEDAASCAADCAVADPCGDGTCDGDEGCGLCPADCGPCAGGCCDSKPDPGCEDAAVQACVCASDTWCCTGSWDSLCVSTALTLCDATCE